MTHFENEGKGVDLYVRTVLKNSYRKEVGTIWTLRTSGHCQTEIEMARALTHDLIRLNVPWQIRDAKGDIVEQWGLPIAPHVSSIPEQGRLMNPKLVLQRVRRHLLHDSSWAVEVRYEAAAELILLSKSLKMC